MSIPLDNGDIVVGNELHKSTGEPGFDSKVLDPWGTRFVEDILPGMDGLPFRGKVPDIKQTDVKQPELGVEAHIDVFEITKENEVDRNKYRDIMQLVANGFAQLSQEKIEFDPQIKGWRIMIRWIRLYTHIPDKSGAK